MLHLAWSPTMVHWVKLNSDGSIIHFVGEAVCGGILRDCHGSFIKASSKLFVLCWGFVLPQLQNYGVLA